MSNNNLFSTPAPHNGKGQMHKFIIFSSALFLLIFVLGSVAFVSLMGQILHDSAGSELMQVVRIEDFRLEAYVAGEIAVARKMAASPLIQHHFMDPDDKELAEIALEEIEGYRQTFLSKSVFWVKDADKKLYMDTAYAYTVNPNDSANYWYNMTLYKTQTYNFNINYNPSLNVTNLWINVPVFNIEHNAVGMLGTGINLSDFVNKVNKTYTGKADLYFFNASGEITWARDVELVAGKVTLEQKLGQTGAKILEETRSLKEGEVNFFEIRGKKGVAAFSRIPLLDWNVVAIRNFTVKDTIQTDMTYLFGVIMLIILFIIVMMNVLASMRQDKVTAELQAIDSKIARERAEAASEAIMRSIEYASKIQRSLLPPGGAMASVFADYSVIWKPRDVVGGDIYWIKEFEEGTVLCICDCTGHGTPGALLTMLVVSALESITWPGNCDDTAGIVWQLDQRLSAVLHVESGAAAKRKITNIDDGCDLAVLFIAKDGAVKFSSGKIPVFVCDGFGVTQYKGQKIFVGEGKLKNKYEVVVNNIPANPNNKFYIASDGLFDQPGGDAGRRFGYNTLKQVILDNHNETQAVITEKIWNAFEEYRGVNVQRDDVELVAFKPSINNNVGGSAWMI